ncbi:MAG: putative transposase, partial [Myxococcota bacterium]
DITKLPGPRRGQHFCLYVVIDLYSRMVVGWLLADCESAALAERLLRETIRRHGVVPGALTIHSDRGAPMTSLTVRQLLADLDVTRSLSRPRVSNDNPFSESQFKTTKYNPWFPKRFASIEDARAFCRRFFEWYNDKHCHSGIASLPPRVVHEGRAGTVLAKRQVTLDAAYAKKPERFPNGPPKVQQLPKAVHINPTVPALDLHDGPPQAEEVRASPSTESRSG